MRVSVWHRCRFPGNSAERWAMRLSEPLHDFSFCNKPVAYVTPGPKIAYLRSVIGCLCDHSVQRLRGRH